MPGDAALASKQQRARPPRRHDRDRDKRKLAAQNDGDGESCLSVTKDRVIWDADELDSCPEDHEAGKWNGQHPPVRPCSDADDRCCAQDDNREEPPAGQDSARPLRQDDRIRDTCDEGQRKRGEAPHHCEWCTPAVVGSATLACFRFCFEAGFPPLPTGRRVVASAFRPKRESERRSSHAHPAS